MKKLFNKTTGIIVGLLLLITIPVLLPLFHAGFFVTDDGEWMIIRFSAFYQAFADGQFPVRFLHRLNFDFGYPVATFLYPGFMYAGIPFHLLKIGVVETIKIIFGLSLIGTTLFTYLWLSKVFTRKSAAFIGAFASIYLPYHLYDVYTRGSVGEIFALVWVPFTFWMIEKKSQFFISIGIALLLLSHNTMALLFLPLLFVYALIRKTFSIKKLFVSFILGLSLSAFFIIPAVFELSFTNFSSTVISNPADYFAKLSLIGISTLLIFIFAGGLYIFQKKSQNEHDSLIRLFLLVTFFTVFLSSSWSAFFWQVIPSSFIQFPFRLLSFLVVSVAFLSAFIVSHIQQHRIKIFVVIGLLIIMLISSYDFVAPKEYINKGEGYYVTNEATTTVHDEYLPTWIHERSMGHALSKVEIIKGEGKVDTLVYDNKQIAFTFNAVAASLVRVNTLYWPGWNVFIDNNKQEFTYNNKKGLMEFAIPQGTHQVRLEFQETPLRLVADVISVISLGLLLFMRVRFKRR